MNRSVEIIKILMEKYFEGETSIEEEMLLQNYFSSGSVNEELDIYRPVFQYFKKEKMGNTSIRIFSRNNIARISIGIAACVLLVLGVIMYPVQSVDMKSEFGCTGTYVKIEGTCYNDPALVFSHAAQAISDLDILLAEDHSIIEDNAKK